MLKCKKISLDLPTGFNKQNGESIFKPDVIMTLAAMKSELLDMEDKVEFYLSDLGLPESIYHEFQIDYPNKFMKSGLLHCKLF